MVRKRRNNKKIEEETIVNDEEEPLEEESFEEETIVNDEEEPLEGQEYSDEEEDGNENSYNTAMQIGGSIHTQDEIFKNFKQLPKDVKYSFFKDLDHKTFLMRSRTYQDLNYQKSVYNMSSIENGFVNEKKRMIYDVETSEDLKEYLENINKSYLWVAIKDIDKNPIKVDKIFPEKKISKFKKFIRKIFGEPKPKKINTYLKNIDKQPGQNITINYLIKQLKETKRNGIVDMIYKDNKENINIVYDMLENKDIKINPVDELGLMNEMLTITEASKGRGGSERKSMNTTISETREHNEREEQSEKNDLISSGLKSLLYRKNNRRSEEE